MRLHHLALRATDVTTTVAFYRDVLRLAVIKHDERSAWLASDAVVIMIEPRSPGEPGRTGDLDLVAFAIPGSERHTCEARIQSMGLTIESQTEHTLYVRDPDGRRVGLSSYVF
jgi:catechol 2,3-dioxygenase-like lactoylglutathione lyase family enzyme